jgi:lipopolysaccharide transport system permease protein
MKRTFPNDDSSDAQPAPARQVKVIRPATFSPRDLLENLRSLASYGDLLRTLTSHRIKVRYKQSQLGVAWALLQPLSLMLIYTLIFSVIVKIPSEGVPYALFAYTALLPWSFFSTALTNAAGGLRSHGDLIRKVYFPRELLPLSYVITALIDFLIASVVLAGLLIYYRVSLTANVLFVVPVLLVEVLFLIAVSLLTSAAQVRIRDISVAMPLILQLWMLSVPILYPLSSVPPRVLPIYQLNPMVGIIENFRRVVLHGQPPDVLLLGVSALSSVILLPLSYIYFKRVEATLADVI